MIRMIAAISMDGVIGLDNKLPFDYPADMKHFRQATAGSTIIMGKRTFESIGKALSNRRNIVISSRPVDAPGVETFSNIPDALLDVKEKGEPCPCEGQPCTHSKGNVWLIGGARIYENGMVFADELHLTLTPDVINHPNAIKFPWINPQMFSLREIKTFETNQKLKLAIYDAQRPMEY